MTASDVRSYLSSISKLKHDINSQIETLEEVRNHAEKTTVSFNLVSGGSSYRSSLIEKYTIQLVTIKEKLYENISTLIETESNAIRIIYLLSDPFKRGVLIRCFIVGQTIEATAEDLGYSRRHILRLIKQSTEDLASVVSPEDLSLSTFAS